MFKRCFLWEEFMEQYNYRYNIAKGVRLVAFAFLFIFLDFNIVSDTFYIDIIPDAVGWVLFFMSIRYLEGYIKNPTGLRVLAFVLLIADINEWMFNMISYDSDLPLNPNDIRFIFFLFALVYNVFYYKILGAMIRVAEDFHSMREQSIRILRPVMIVIHIAAYLHVLIWPDEESSLFYIVIIAGCIVALINLFILFGLKKDVENVPKAFYDDFETVEDYGFHSFKEEDT